MIRRGVWLAAGFGLGVAAATRGRRRVEAAATRLAPTALADRVRRDVADALAVGRDEMRAREVRLRHVLASPHALDAEGVDGTEQ